MFCFFGEVTDDCEDEEHDEQNGEDGRQAG
jgi:hypothetical protein